MAITEDRSCGSHKLCKSQLRPPTTFKQKCVEFFAIIDRCASHVLTIFRTFSGHRENPHVTSSRRGLNGEMIVGQAWDWRISCSSQTRFHIQQFTLSRRPHLAKISKAFVHQLNNMSAYARYLVALAQHPANSERAGR